MQIFSSNDNERYWIKEMGRDSPFIFTGRGEKRSVRHHVRNTIVGRRLDFFANYRDSDTLRGQTSFPGYFNREGTYVVWLRLIGSPLVTLCNRPARVLCIVISRFLPETYRRPRIY